ncbi:MAG: type II toxin-antitoxin system VapC family toxin [Nitrospirae bacterium]|jgi:predicted nucleic acid-binding protein|nr:type II toxin-antitoxin system VapC family toxin [Nitrospirota bacterium]
MITSLDTNILLDVLIPDDVHFQRSKKLLDEHFEKGQLIICEVVHAELASQFPAEKDIRAFLGDTGIRLIHSSEKALYIAGERWRQYAKDRDQKLQCPYCGNRITVTCSKCGHNIYSRQHIISDFLIAAHAIVHAEILLSRDRGFYRAYFKNLKVIG